MYSLHVITLEFTEISTKIILLHDFPTFNVGYPCKVKIPTTFTWKSKCGDFKITGIAGIHAIP